MLRALTLGSQSVDVLDLKVLLVSHGANLPEDVYRVLAEQYRVQDPGDLVACNGLLLPGEVAAHVWQNDESPFSIALDERQQPYLAHQGRPVTPITFPRATRYYDQRTPGGVRYGTVAVLEGQGTLAFHYMWPCAYARTGEHCQFCFQVLADVSGIELPTPTPRDVGEIVAWALEDGAVKELQLTAGSRLNPASECERYASILRSIDEVAGLERLEGEAYVYLTAPKDPASLDQVFEAGADRICIDLDIWDLPRWERICSGHARHVGRATQLRALEAVAARYGPNKACSAFVVGLEPVETLLAGAEYLAQRGIVPLLSVWFPGADPRLDDVPPPGLDYYRAVRRGFAALFERYGLKPPGLSGGSHVAMDADVYRFRHDLLESAPT